ncbi:TIGR02391 family protein [Agromyces sp. M3QZ16-3]|uniref:TIGR02391 family protein n=1 Tax=Agromyces sp. M3QZ16-3 TaxID=3447585 RepID=UPI003F68ED53
MDYEWAEGVLDDWLSGIAALPKGGSELLYARSPEVDYLVERHDQTRRVVARIRGLTTLPELISRHTEYYIFTAGEEAVRYALGRLKTKAETEAKLGSSAPRMAADAMHPLVWESASTLWGNEHYSEAVQRAATFLNAHVQSLLGRTDVSDAVLMQEAFSSAPPAVDKPRLRWPGRDSDLTVKSMRDAIRGYSVGCFQGIRNPATHSTEAAERQECLEQLAALSLLARWIDRCEVTRA